MSTKTTDPDIIKLNNVRLSYPQLFEPRAAAGSDKLKYSATFLLDKKEHAGLIKHIEKQIERVALDFFKKKVTLKKSCLHDGNEKEDTEGYGDEVMFVTSSDTRRPVVVDRDLTPLTKDDNKPYAGCYVNATVRLYAYDHKVGGKGVSMALRAVQFVKDGESFGAGPVNAEEEFEPVSADADDY